jgi:hypothetical protein
VPMKSLAEPTRAVRPLVRSASKRLSTDYTRSAIQTRAGAAMPSRSFGRRSYSSKGSPRSR